MSTDADAVEADVVAVLADACRPGMDSDAGVAALNAGIRRLLATHRAYDVLGVALCGWGGLVEATAERAGVDAAQLIAHVYARDEVTT
jgi:hypothetical protein